MERTRGAGYTSPDRGMLPSLATVRHSRSEESVEQEERETPGVARNQNVVYVLPNDWTTIAQFLAPALERVDADIDALQLLVITPDVESAIAITSAAVRLAGDRALRVVPATAAGRAQRLLRERAAHVVAGAPPELLALLTGSSLKLDQLRLLVLAWADELVSSGADAALESLLAEVPKDAARIMVASQSTPAVEALGERYLRRARRVGGESAEGGEVAPIPLRFVSAAAAARPAALRRLLDDLDPADVTVYVRAPDEASDVERALRGLGYDAGSGRTSSGAAAPGTGLVVLYDLPASRHELATLVGGVRDVVAIVQPRQLGTLRTLAGAHPRALTLPGAGARARGRDAALRDELRAQLLLGAGSRELLALEPLLEEFDGIEVAAAAVRLLERERERVDASVTAGASAPAATSAMTRLYVSIGARDGIRPGDLVGALAGEGGITSSQIGKIELRDNHALVEVDGAVAARVAERVTGISIKGRRVIARVDAERPHSDRPARSERPARDDRPRDDRPPRRDAPRGERQPRRDSPGRGPSARSGPPRGRSDRPDRPDRPPRGEARPRFGDDRTTRPRRPRPGGGE